MTKLAALRNQRKLTQKQVATQIGISPAHYAQCEIGMKRLGTKPLQKLAEFYQMPIDELFEASPRRSASYQIVPTALLQDILTSPAEDVDRAWDYLRHLRKKSSEKGEDDE